MNSQPATDAPLPDEIERAINEFGNQCANGEGLDRFHIRYAARVALVAAIRAALDAKAGTCRWKLRSAYDEFFESDCSALFHRDFAQNFNVISSQGFTHCPHCGKPIEETSE